MSNLLIHGHKVEVIPSLNNLSLVDPDNCDTCKLDRSLSRSSPHELAFVLSPYRAPRSDFVTFSNHIVDNDHDVWERSAERCVKGSVAAWTSNWTGRIIRQAVSDSILSEHLVDCLSASVVPHFLKPATE